MNKKMNIGFVCESGEIPEIGTGHYYRSKYIINALNARKHNAFFLDKTKKYKELDVLVVDDLRSQRDFIIYAKNTYKNTKIVLIDGVETDLDVADVSVSAFFNKKSCYRGIKYMVFNPCFDKTYKNGPSNHVFVGVGGFDANMLVENIIKALDLCGLQAYVAKSINHEDVCEKFNNAKFFVSEDYYSLMDGCLFGIVNGGLTMYQALHFGLPCIAIPQYDHQKENIHSVKSCCICSDSSIKSLQRLILVLKHNSAYRSMLSEQSKLIVDGKSLSRVCDIIEDCI